MLCSSGTNVCVFMYVCILVIYIELIQWCDEKCTLHLNEQREQQRKQMNPITGVCEKENADVKLQFENFNSCQH